MKHKLYSMLIICCFFSLEVLINGKKVYVETGTFDGCEEAINIKDGTTLVCDWNKDKERIECNTED